MTNNQILGLFPGQGSQRVGMGKDFYDNFAVAKELFDIADRALGFSLRDLCFNGPEDSLKNTAIAQPAILTVSTICYSIAQSQRPVSLAAAAGHSLGEYSALVAAGAIDFADAVLLVHKRGTYMQEAVPVGEGKMIAVLGKELDEIESALSKISIGVAQVANINAPGQIVIAGNVEGVQSFVTSLGTAKTVELSVSAPFHCSLMKPAELRLAEDLKWLKIKRCQFPVYTNYSASPVFEPEDVRKALELQVCNRVRWVECMENSIRAHGTTSAVEFGEGSVLSGLLKRINNSVKRMSVSVPPDISKLELQ